MSDNGKKEKQRAERDARRSRGEKKETQKEGEREEEGRVRAVFWRVRINKLLY
jgi:hypothetical protein